MADGVVTVPVSMPGRVWGRLASYADHDRVRIAELIADAVEVVILESGGSVSRRAQLAALCRAGFGLERIAAEMRVDPKRVRRWLADEGLATAAQRRRSR